MVENNLEYKNFLQIWLKEVAKQAEESQSQSSNVTSAVENQGPRDQVTGPGKGSSKSFLIEDILKKPERIEEKTKNICPLENQQTSTLTPSDHADSTNNSLLLANLAALLATQISTPSPIGSSLPSALENQNKQTTDSNTNLSSLSPGILSQISANVNMTPHQCPIIGNSVKRSKRKARTAFTPFQLSQLENRFLVQKYLTPVDRDEIAGSLKLNPAQVITWFQNRRAKMKREISGGC